MAFTIAGRDQGHPVLRTRERPTGASLLADKWIKHGFTDVHIEWKGRSFDVASFRALFVLTRKGIRLRPGVAI